MRGLCDMRLSRAPVRCRKVELSAGIVGVSWGLFDTACFGKGDGFVVYVDVFRESGEMAFSADDFGAEAPGGSGSES